MISLTINNFKNVLTEKTYDFPYGDLFHLVGCSGAGKTTVLNAFEWVLFGKMTNIKPRAYKDKTPFVSLRLEDLNIVRDNNDLTVTLPNKKTLTSDAAQGYICSRFGDRDLWKSCSYLEQGSRSLLLTGSSEDKLRILRELTYGYGIGQEDDPEYYLTIFGEAVKKCLKEKSTKNAQYDAFYEETSRALTKFEDSDNKWEESEYEISELKEDLKFLNSEVKRKRNVLSEYNHISKEILEIQKKININNDFQKKFCFNLESYNKEKEALNNSIVQVENKLRCYKLGLKAKTFLPYSRNLEKLQGLLNDQSEWKSWSNKMIKVGLNHEMSIENLHQMQKDLVDYKKWESFNQLCEKKKFVEDLQSYIDDVQHDLLSLELKIETENKKIQSLDKESLLFDRKKITQSISDFKKKKCLVCPGCKIQLYINEKNNLNIADDIDISKLECDLSKIESQLKLLESYDKLIVERKDLQKDLKESIADLNAFDFSQEDYDKLKDTVKPKINPKLTDETLLDLIETFKSRPDLDKIKLFQNGEDLSKILGDDFESFENDPSNYIFDNNSLEQEIKNLNMEKQKLESSKDAFTKSKTEEEMLQRDLKQKESRLESLERVSEEEIMDMESKIKDLTSLEFDHIRYVEMDDKMNTLNKYEENLDIVNKRLERLEVIYEIIKKTSIEPMEKVIEVLNQKINLYLDRLFSDNPIRVLLSLFKTSSGPKISAFTKIAVNLQIYHGENSYPNINSLSGGEADRVSLAITLALSNLSPSPFLFLDECMASLDSELREQCLFLIRENKNTDKIVIDVCHETVEGFHDRIVKIV